MPEHPASYLLEEVAAGVGDEQTSQHVEQCEACRAYVTKLEAGAADFAQQLPSAEQFADGVVERSKSSGKRAWIAAGAALSLVAAAAVLFLVLRPPEATVGPVAMATTTTDMADATGVRFKGAPQIAVIRERDGQQQRLSVEAGIRAKDRLRVEISVDAPTMVEVGVLSEDGAWVALLPAKQLTPGTHFSPQAVRFDEAPSNGWVIAGSPEAVDRARKTKRFEGVTVIPLHVEKGR
jgi:hypothetical protein